MHSRLVSACVLAGLMVPVAHGTVIPDLTNGDFTLPGLPPPQNLQGLTIGSTFVTGWLVVNGIGNQIGAGEYATDRGQSGACVELGAYASLSGIQQTFPTLPDQQYQVGFWLATDALNPPTAMLRATVGNFTQDYSANPPTGSLLNMGWLPETFFFTTDGSGSTTLLFQNIVGTAAIDTITLTPVPEASIATFGVLACTMHLMWRCREKDGLRW